MNTLPLRIQVAGQISFREFLGLVRRRFFDGLSHADVSYEACLPQLRGQEAPWWVPPFRYMFNFRPPAGPGWDPGFPGEVIDVASGVSRLDLELIPGGAGVGQRRRGGLFDGGAGLEPSLRSGEPGVERVDGGGAGFDAGSAGVLVAGGLDGGVHPDDAVPLGGGQR